MLFKELEKLSLFPIVDLKNPGFPKPGAAIGAPKCCSKNMEKSDSCLKYYMELNRKPDGVYQCPFGLASFRFTLKDNAMAITSFIPYPRLGGKPEKELSDKYTDHRIATSIIANSAEAIKKIAVHISELEDKTVANYSMALHEIRKLNRTVKHSAERLKTNPNLPSGISEKVLQIHKTSELMSHQFDIIEILANEGLAKLPVSTLSEIYRLLDKCMHIYQTENSRLKLSSSLIPTPRVNVCDKTISIILTVLIENALKYSKPNSNIYLDLKPSGKGKCILRVENIAEGTKMLTNEVFKKGIRFDNTKEGSGFGLYVAQLVAKQHNTLINVQSQPMADFQTKHLFSIEFSVVE